ncbi:DUF551 domain-containing protein [Escherichia coli]|uniref:DUF551 domain-containing protein n=1 Tax=Escherichia coli TaxID=562 RepID=UPI0030FF55DB
MTTITREKAEIKSFITGFLSDPAHDNQSSNSLLANVFRIALASLEAEPVAWMRDDADGREYNARNEFSYGGRGIPLYAAPPATVVPDERAAFNAWNNDENLPIAGVGAKNAAWLAWQARAELGRSLAVNSPGTPDSWISCSDRMPEKGQNVLISVNFDSSLVEPLICSARYTGSTFRRGDATIKPGNGIEQATHWMLLPEPPQEVK